MTRGTPKSQYLTPHPHSPKSRVSDQKVRYAWCKDALATVWGPWEPAGLLTAANQREPKGGPNHEETVWIGGSIAILWIAVTGLGRC